MVITLTKRPPPDSPLVEESAYKVSRDAAITLSLELAGSPTTFRLQPGRRGASSHLCPAKGSHQSQGWARRHSRLVARALLRRDGRVDSSGQTTHIKALGSSSFFFVISILIFLLKPQVIGNLIAKLVGRHKSKVAALPDIQVCDATHVSNAWQIHI